MKYLLKFYYNRVLYQKYCILLKNRRYFSYNKFITFVSLNRALKLSYIQCIQTNTSQFRDSIFDPSSPPKIHQRKKEYISFPDQRSNLELGNHAISKDGSYPRQKRISSNFRKLRYRGTWEISPSKKEGCFSLRKKKEKKKKIKRFFVLVMDVPWTRERRENR